MLLILDNSNPMTENHTEEKSEAAEEIIEIIATERAREFTIVILALQESIVSRYKRNLTAKRLRDFPRDPELEEMIDEVQKKFRETALWYPQLTPERVDKLVDRKNLAGPIPLFVNAVGLAFLKRRTGVELDPNTQATLYEARLVVADDSFWEIFSRGLDPRDRIRRIK